MAAATAEEMAVGVADRCAARYGWRRPGWPDRTPRTVIRWARCSSASADTVADHVLVREHRLSGSRDEIRSGRGRAGLAPAARAAADATTAHESVTLTGVAGGEYSFGMRQGRGEAGARAGAHRRVAARGAGGAGQDPAGDLQRRARQSGLSVRGGTRAEGGVQRVAGLDLLGPRCAAVGDSQRGEREDGTTHEMAHARVTALPTIRPVARAAA